jgi:uncharacterized SAM-binding protein YcdF (DUF218 family)
MPDKNLIKTAYPFLAISEPPQKSDLILGLGSFDLRVAFQCWQLYNSGFATTLLFSGGAGAGSGNLNEPEALAYKRAVLATNPTVAEQHILTEPDSTNTGENFMYSKRLLQKAGKFNGIKKILLVTTPARQRRAWLAAKKHWPGLEIVNAPQQKLYEQDKAYYHEHEQDLDKLIIGELYRIRTYPEKGFIVKGELPNEFLELIESGN